MSASATITGTQWAVDPTHSEIGFRIKHLMITNVKGTFNDFTATVRSQGNFPITPDVVVSINPGSIDTGDANRDAHLRTNDFFGTDEFRTIEFRGKSVERKSGDDQFVIHGELTMKGITHPVSFDVELGGLATDPWGNEKAGVSVNGKINRKDWGLTYNAALETGGMLLGDEVKISAELQLVKQ